MTATEQQIAIANACGLECGISPFSGSVLRYIREPGQPVWFGKEVPDYLNDLNAIHSAENVLHAKNYAQLSLGIHHAIG